MNLGQPRFLVDMNVGRLAVTAFTNRGYDAVYIGDVNPRMSDTEVLQMAVQTQRVVVTFDSDFGELVFRSRESHAGVLSLRVPGSTAEDRTRVIGEILADYVDRLSGRFSVYRSGRLRIR